MANNMTFINEPSHNWDLTEFSNSWESIVNDTTAGFTVLRMRVPGGFLVVTRDTSASTSDLTFIAEPSANWTMGS